MSASEEWVKPKFAETLMSVEVAAAAHRQEAFQEFYRARTMKDIEDWARGLKSGVPGRLEVR